MSKILSFSMYFLSYIPLWIAVIFLDIKSLFEGGCYKWTEKISILLIVIFFFVTFIYLRYTLNRLKSNRSFDEYKLIKAKECKTLTTELLLSYILPLFAFDFTLWYEVVEFLIFFLILGYLCIWHNYFNVTIILEIMGYKMYECTLTNKDNKSIERMVISKQTLTVCKGEDIKVKDINNEVLFDIEK